MPEKNATYMTMLDIFCHAHPTNSTPNSRCSPGIPQNLQATGQSEKITITNDKGRLTEEQIAQMLQEAEEFAEEDKKAKHRGTKWTQKPVINGVKWGLFIISRVK